MQIVTIRTSDNADDNDNDKYVILLETDKYLYVTLATPGTKKDRDNWGKLGSNPPRHIRQIPLEKITGLDCHPWNPVRQKRQEGTSKAG